MTKNNPNPRIFALKKATFFFKKRRNGLKLVKFEQVRPQKKGRKKQTRNHCGRKIKLRIEKPGIVAKS